MRSRLLVLIVLGAFAVAAGAAPGAASAAFGPVSSFSTVGRGAGQIYEPGGGEYAPDGDFYLADYGNDRIDVFSPTGSFLFAFGLEVNPEDGGNLCTAAGGCEEGVGTFVAGALDEPEDLALHEGDVYVADRGNDRIDKFTEAGEFVAAFGLEVNETDSSDVCDDTSGCVAGSDSGENASVAEPTGITFAKTDLFVADYENDRVDVVSPDGVFEGAFGKETNEAGGGICPAFLGATCQKGEAGTEAGAMDHPYGIATTPGDGLAVAEEDSHRLDTFNYFGAFEKGIGAAVAPGGDSVCTAGTGCVAGSTGSGPGALPEPTAVALDAGGNYYVGDDTLNRVGEFSPAGQFVRAFGAGVVDGAQAFQICTVACQAGLGGATIAGATPHPFGLAFDSQGRLAVVEESKPGAAFARIELFAETSSGSASTITPSAKASPAASPINSFRLRRIKFERKAGTAILIVSPGAPGGFLLSGKSIHKARGHVAEAGGSAKLKVRPTGQAKRKLGKTGKVKVGVQVTFTPTGGLPRTKQKTLVLKKKLARR